MKAIDKYEEPEYTTGEDSRNKIFRFMMRSKKISIITWFIICISSNEIIAVPLDMVVGGMVSAVRPFSRLSTALAISSIIIFIIALVIAIIGEIKSKKTKKKVYTILSLIFLISSIILFAISIKLLSIVEYI